MTTYTYYLKDEDGDIVDQTNIDEPNDALALEIFTQDGQELPENYTLVFEEVDDDQDEE